MIPRIEIAVLAGLLLTALTLGPSARAAETSPVAQWDFGTESATAMRPEGGVHRDVPGPRPPEYPDFAPDNTAVKLDGRGARLVIADPGPQSPFDFTDDDAITIEAWVQVDEIGRGENVYVIGKGRTGAEGFAPDNQNWALRVREVGGKAGVSFLFATEPPAAGSRSPEHWHRWTSETGFTPGRYWHHIAVSYRFGDPESIRGWIDGQSRPGAWDMGGATTESPVMDDDAIWIGSSVGGAPGNSFRGCLDAIALHRNILAEEVLERRFRRVGEEIIVGPAPERMPDLGELSGGSVTLALCEGMPAHDRWLNTDEVLPAETVRWQGESFLIDRLPNRYDAWGIRDSWKGPVLLRMGADVVLRPGTHRLLARVRGLSRLWVDGELVARSEPMIGSPNGEEPMTPVADPPAPRLRRAEHRQQEISGEAVIIGDGPVRVVLETLVGGQALRADPGETCVAIQPEGERSFWLLGPTDPAVGGVELTDSSVGAALGRLEERMVALDDAARRAAAASQDAVWVARHTAARQWAAQHPVPSAISPTAHPIDAFLEAKIERSLAAAANSPEAARQFHQEVLPILREGCFRCHGERDKGGLSLASREGMLDGGDSGSPAIVPGDIDSSELMRRVRAEDSGERMPPGDERLTASQIEALASWVDSGAPWPAPPVSPEDVAPPPTLDDAAFLRRASLDTVGVPPTEAELRAFLGDTDPDKRRRAVDRLVEDDRWADHWTSYWQDVLAENPTLINASLNTTGPFRWFLYEAFRDNKPWDRLVTELIAMRGSPHHGGSAGFRIAANNDAPLAAKGQIIASALLGVQLECARCHDSPYHETTQRDLYSLAAMLAGEPLVVPASSRVADAFFDHLERESLIRVTLAPDEAVEPVWPLAEVCGVSESELSQILPMPPADSRERLAVLITVPQNERFSQVIVNRVWRRLMGAGFVEPADDWEGQTPSHPELLAWLARDFVAHGYDLKHLVRRIMTSAAYQRRSIGANRNAAPELRMFTAPDSRRLTAEQIVDSLYAAAGQRMEVEEMTFDPDARRAASNRLSLGVPRRAWMFASLANERDRPSLNLPRARAVVDILEAFGWSGSRQNPRTDRESSPNLLQPGVMANSTATVWLTRVVVGSEVADLAAEAESPEELVDRVFLRYLSRYPTETEREPLVRALAVGFPDRLLPISERAEQEIREPLPRVTWSNHLRPEANRIALELEAQARRGPPADPRFRAAWREVLEDVLWSVINVREFVWMP